MALFGRNKRGLDYPPQNSVEEGEEEEAHVETAEPIFRPKPEPLDITSILEKVKAGEAIAMMPELDQFYFGWFHHAQDHKVFISNPAIKALEQARREVIALATQKKFNELKAKLEELAGPVAAEVEAAVEKNIKHIQQNREATRKEHKEALAGAVSEVQELRHEEREARAAALAEKYGISAEREALLSAEQDYAAAIRERNEGFFKLKFRDDAATREERLAVESALKKWREALTGAIEEARNSNEKQDMISARFIGARDGMMRMEQVRQRAVVEGLDNRSKTTLGKIDAWANRLNAKALSVTRTSLDKLGKVSEAVGGVAVGLVVDKEKDAEKYKRASRIVGSAAIMTAIFAPFGAVTAGAAGMTFLWRTVRGLGGVVVGSTAGAGAGKFYELRHGSQEERLEEHQFNQEILINALKTGIIEAYSSEQLEKFYKKGSKTQFKKSEQAHAERKMREEVAAAALVAGISAYGLSHFPPVHDALTNHSPVTPVAHGGLGSTQVEHHSTSTVHSTHASEALPVIHIDSVSVHGNVNDADKLFGRFVDNARAQFPNPTSAPPALRALLEQYHHVDGMHQQDVLTRFLHLQNGGSVVVHPGDTLSYEDGKVVFQGHTLIDEHGTVHNLREGGLVDIEHPHPHVAPTSQHVEQSVTHETVQPVTPEPVTTSAPEHVEQPAPAPAPEHVVERPPTAPAPEHVEQPAPVATPAVSHTPIPESSGVAHSVISTPSEHIEHPSPSNDNAPSLESTAPGINHEAFVNPHGVHIEPRGVHLYGVAEGRGKETLIAYGTPDPTSGKDFMGSISDLLKRNPTATVYFQSPTPTYINGVPQPWISSATLSPDGKVIVSVTPSDTNLVGVKINPGTFTRVIN